MTTDGYLGGLMSEQPGDLSPMRRVPPSARLVLGTANAHTVGELRAILAAEIAGFDTTVVVGSGDLGLPSPVEDGVTFEENALLKAHHVARATRLPALADDSGLVVDVFGGAPGVFSARWAGHHGDDRANLGLLLAQLEDVPEHHRGARFVCAAALVTPAGEEYVEVAEIRGSLLLRPEGHGGFGYDPIFQPRGYSRSMASLTPAEKNAISHRGKAFRALADEIASVISRG